MEEILQPIYRIEDYWYAIANGLSCPHTPIYRIEQYLAYLCGADVEVPQPIYRIEQYLAYKCGLDVELPTPIYRDEMFLAKWCGMDVEPPTPIYRIETLLSQLSNGELKTVTGNPISISDALAKPAESLSIEILPQQDLHGYDNPWPAGGGKNKADIADSTITMQTTLATISLPVGSFTFSATVTNNTAITGYLTIRLNGTTVTSFSISSGDSSVRKSCTLVVSAEAEYDVIASGASSGYSFTLEKCQLESGGSVTDYAPYSNICPISGFTGVNILRTGKNLLDSSTKEITSDTVARWAYSGFKLLAGQAYTLSSNNPSATVYITEAGTTTTIRSGSPSITYTPTVDTDVSFRAYLTPSVSDVELQLELGSTATAYEPYTGTTYSIDWTDEAGTVYGGSLDVTTGALTVTHGYIASYSGESLPSSWISDRDKYEVGTTPTAGAEVVYELATPLTIQLTPTEIQLLLGNNVLWNDVDGDMTLEYLADGPADDADALQILLNNRYVNNGGADEATDREALDILLGGNTR